MTRNRIRELPRYGIHGTINEWIERMDAATVNTSTDDLMLASMQEPPVQTVIQDAESVYAAIESRFCCREFLPAPVERDKLERILRAASWAPSGSNIQPWKVYIVQGASRDELSRKVLAAHDAISQDPAQASQYQEAYRYYPRQWVAPYIDRRRACGWGLYGTLDITKGDRERMHAQHQRNFKFFDAPTGIFFTHDNVLEDGALVDTAMFIQNVMIAARAEGLHTCVQAAWNQFASIVLPHIGAGEERLVCALSLGYADTSAIVNGFRPDRTNPAVFTKWLE